MSLQTLKNKAFRVSVQWNALVRKPLSLERGGFTDDLRFYNELTPLVSFAKRLYIVGIDSANTNNENSAELKHASENYDDLKGLIKRFQLKHDSVAWLELESFVNRDSKADKDLLLDFVL